ncbi:MAG: methylmalonyl Co-A mutase-associated GTPase MeaB [Spirochaetota bacterium]|nr:methylmalonyl Co-A mutase-associated GTPase MeaB [Spirochaetota bacterium]
MNSDYKDLIREMEEGSMRAMAKLITRVENREHGWLDIMKDIYPKTGRAQVLGITGSPGAGKSTLTDQLIQVFVDRGHNVGIIAVDPSSPFSGGALLGDRLRMNKISSIEGVFIRSMATRGALGGLSLAARDVIKIMDASGKDIILVETVGVGQDEVDVVRAADIVIVVCVPGMGDSIQAIKAGIMEIADIFVVNKADRKDADQVVLDIQNMLNFDSEVSEGRNIPILKTIASTGEGISALADAFFQGLNEKERKKDWYKDRLREEILGLLEKEVARHLRNQFEKDSKLESHVEHVLAREDDPYSIVQMMMDNLIHP